MVRENIARCQKATIGVKSNCCFTPSFAGLPWVPFNRGLVMLNRRNAFALLCALGISVSIGADWAQFRGPHGLGVSQEKGSPAEWSTDKNIVWRTVLPGAGASCPITVGKRIYLTCYSGYGLNQSKP